MDVLSPEQLDRLVALRHDLHRHPELGFEEYRTQRIVHEHLEASGLLAIDGVRIRECAETGLVVDVPCTAGEGPTIALRADLDALPMQEETDIPHRSVHDGCAHKCGHDGHTTMLCGLAGLLGDLRKELRGTVRLVFQPDEEGNRGGGAPKMIEERVLDGVEEIYGLHNWPGFPKGSLRVAAGPVMAAVEDFRIELRGVGGHASQPQDCHDPILAGSQLVSALSSLAMRETGLDGGAVVQLTQFHGGDTFNVIPEEVWMAGTLRAFDPVVLSRLRVRIAETATAVTQAFGVDAIVRQLRGYPVLVNDAECTQAVERAGAAVLGAEQVGATGLPIAASEDFAFFTEKVRGAYFFLGAGKPEGRTPGCHHPDFDFDDDLIPIGVSVFQSLLRDRLGPGIH